MQKFYKICGVKYFMQRVKTVAVLVLATFLSVTAVANVYVPTTFTDPAYTAINNATGVLQLVQVSVLFLSGLHC